MGNNPAPPRPVLMPIIRPSNPQNFQMVVALPVTDGPLFPRFSTRHIIQDPWMFSILLECYKSPFPYVGVFLTEDRDGTNQNTSTSSDPEKSSENKLLNHLHRIGTLAEIISIEDKVVLLHGCQRLQIIREAAENSQLIEVNNIQEKPYDKDNDGAIKETCIEIMETLTVVLEAEKLETYNQLIGDSDYSILADFVAINMETDKLLLQQVLAEPDVYERLKLSLDLAKNKLEHRRQREKEILEQQEQERFQYTIMGEDERRQFLETRLQSIYKLLGQETNNKQAMSVKFMERLQEKKDKCPSHVQQVIKEQLTKLQSLDVKSNEFGTTYDYLEWLTLLPWGDYSDEKFNENILEADHYGLTDVKARILEFIAVRELTGSSQGKIICLCGPPGVGKTSIGHSIARALNRKFYRLSVGGLDDVREIKGAARMYVGATPGKIVQCLKSLGKANPLILIDEIDKLGKRLGGDPANALLELLDPHQNSSFLDYYVDVPIDLSKVLFICTANDIEGIPSLLQDRMEIIEITGYTNEEKLHIAREYIIRNKLEACGLKPEQVYVQDDALISLIENYCPEAGIRNLQKHIEKIFRKVALNVFRQRKLNEPSQGTAGVAASNEPNKVDTKTDVEDVKSMVSPAEDASVDASIASIDGTKDALVDKGAKVVIDISNLVHFVGEPEVQAQRAHGDEMTPVGVAMGLASNDTGGLIFYIETTKVEGSQQPGLMVTGNIGHEMKESAQIAHTVARAVLHQKEPYNPFFMYLLHLHVLQVAPPKDGPSAGCVMVTSMLSFAIGKPVRKHLAMTGELSLTGRILRVGKVKEKIIAAKRNGVKIIIFPSANRRDVELISSNDVKGLEFHFVNKYNEIYDIAFACDDPTMGHHSPEEIQRSSSRPQKSTKCCKLTCGLFRG